MEESDSGLFHRLGKAAYRKVSRVRIPPPPPARTMKDVTYYEFIAIMDNVRVKIIIKEVLGGEKYFWSIVPFWGIDKATSRRILHSGDPESD